MMESKESKESEKIGDDYRKYLEDYREEVLRSSEIQVTQKDWVTAGCALILLIIGSYFGFAIAQFVASGAIMANIMSYHAGLESQNIMIKHLDGMLKSGEYKEFTFPFSHYLTGWLNATQTSLLFAALIACALKM
jgi:hypothetical protein